MAFHHSEPVAAPDLFHRILERVGRAATVALEAQSHQAELTRLLEKSDAQLAEMGLTRDQIPEYVFGNLIHI